MVFQQGNQIGSQSPLEAAVAADFDSVDYASESSGSLHNADSIVRRFEELHLQRSDGSTDGNSLAQYLRRPIDTDNRLMEPQVRLTVIRELVRLEGANQDILPDLQKVQTAFERQVSELNNGQELTPAAYEEQLYVALLEQLKDFYEVIVDSNVEQDRTASEVAAGTFNRALLKFNLNTSGAEKTAILAGLGAALLWVYTNKSTAANGIKSLINGSLWVGAGAYLLNSVTKAATGEGILEGLEHLNRRNNVRLGRFFGLNLAEDEDEETMGQMLEAVVYDPILRERSFSLMVSSYSPTSDKMPGIITRGTGVDTDEENVHFHRAMGLIINKFGPTSEAYARYPEVAEAWERAMDNPDISLQQAFFELYSAHPDAPDDLVPTHTELIKDFVVEHTRAIASPTITWSRRAFEAAVEHTPGQALGFIEAMRRLAPGGEVEDGQLANFINRQIESPEQMTGFDGNYGRFAYAALNSNNQHKIFEDATGVAYTTIQLNLNGADFVNETMRHERIVSAYMEAFDRFQDEYGQSANLADNINILFGAEQRVAGAGGTYYIAFTYRTPDSLVRENHDLAPRNLDTRYEFALENFTPTEKAFAMAFYQTDEAGLQRYFDYVLSNMPSQRNTLTDKYEYFLSVTTRADVIDHFSVDYDEARDNYMHTLDGISLNHAHSIAGQTEQNLFLNSVALIQSLYANPDNWDQIGVPDNTSYEEAAALFNDKVEEYLHEFNTNSFQSFAITAPLTDSTIVERAVESGDEYEIATQVMFDGLCDRERTGLPANVPSTVWRFEYESSDPTEYALSVNRLNLVEGSTMYFGAGTTIKCDNGIVADFYRNLDFRDANGNRLENFTYNETTKTLTFNSSAFLSQSVNNDYLMRGSKISGQVYYYLRADS